MRNGASPQRPGSSRRISSQAQMSAEARWNCCEVSRRSVYRMITATPSRPSRPATTPCSLRIASVNAVRPRYASVLPPPVGKNSRSPRPVPTRSGCVGRVRAGRFSRMKASWNGRHDRFLGMSASARADRGASAVSSRRALAASEWTRCCHIARLANRKASRAPASRRRRSSEPASASRALRPSFTASAAAPSKPASDGSAAIRRSWRSSHRPYPETSGASMASSSASGAPASTLMSSSRPASSGTWSTDGASVRRTS